MSCDTFKSHKCSKCDNRKIIVVEQKRSKYTLTNEPEKYICKIDVDGCLVTEGMRCDYLVINCEDNVAYCVELKGKNLSHAIEQITQSIKLLSDKLTDCKINARIVLTKVTTPTSKNYHKRTVFQKFLKRHNNGNFEKGTIRLEEPV
ncbi:MAG: hypothetical protein HQK99_15695 [Nitrospirae bacterium]|nr:hypothetical protein [Nitrospirota bacterium]